MRDPRVRFNMETIFDPPFLTRVYPSPRTAKEVTVHVKEMPLTDYPHKYAERQSDAAANIGNHLLCTDVRGSRAWSIKEHAYSMEEWDTIPVEHPWMEVWEIGTTNQIAVLDLVMYTGFYTDQTMDRFDKFVDLVMPLIKDHAAVIVSASGGGVSVKVRQIEKVELKRAAESVLDFNAVHFGFEMPRAQHLRQFLKTKTLWFGYC